MTRSDLVAQCLAGVLAGRAGKEDYFTHDFVADAESIANAAIAGGAVQVIDESAPGQSDIDQALDHLRKARAAFVLAGRENDAESVREAISKVEATRLELGFPAEPAKAEAAEG